MSALTSLDAATLVAEQGSIVTIPDSFTSIDDYAFAGNQLRAPQKINNPLDSSMIPIMIC